MESYQWGIYISIPEYIGRNTSVLRLESGIWNPSTMKYGDYDIIVIQPWLWTGSIHPVRVKLTPEEMDYSKTWYVNASLRIHIYMCTPFWYYCDGYKMTIFIVTDPNDIQECKIFKWCYSDTSSYNPYRLGPDPGDQKISKMRHSVCPSHHAHFLTQRTFEYCIQYIKMCGW